MTRIRPSGVSALVSLSLGLVLAACAEPEGIDLRLVSDPNVNAEAEVVAALDSIVLVVDSDEGLYPPGDERVGDGVQIENADSDPDLELIATVPAPTGRLPVIRLLRGTLPERSLELRLLGLRAPGSDEMSAIGRVQGVRLTAPIEEIAVSFNLLPELLPPRVTEVLPSDGATISGCALRSILVMFSAPVDEASLRAGLTVTPGEVTDVTLDPSGRTAQITLEGLSGDGLEVGFRIALAETVVDREGRPIDQVPTEDGAQPFDTSVRVTCSRGSMTPEFPCATSEPGRGTCPFPTRLECVDRHCVPTGCDDAVCGDRTVCDPASGHCEADCRLWGEANPCPESRPECDVTNGVCVAP